MKKFLIGSMFLGLASLGYSQSSDCGKKEIRLSGIELTPMNQTYLAKVSDGAISDKVYSLEKKASHYNIKENSLFDGKPNTVYRIGFYGDGGRILATYDHNGKILYANEKYQNTTLPLPVRNSLYRENPDWVLKETTYKVTYNGKIARKMYSVQIGKEGLNKNLKFDMEGNRLK